MDEEAAKPRDIPTNQQQQYYYGTFQGVANYHPPAPPPQLLPLPQHPIAANSVFPGHVYQNLQGVNLSLSLSLSLILVNCNVFCFVTVPCLRLLGPPGGGFVNYAQGFPVVPGTLNILLSILVIHFWRNLSHISHYDQIDNED